MTKKVVFKEKNGLPLDRKKQILRVIMLNNDGNIVKYKKYVTRLMSRRIMFRAWMFMDASYFPVSTHD